jgi:MFS family permease
LIPNLNRRQVFLRILLPFALGYFLSYLYRTINAVLSPDLVAELGLDADDLGLLTASYFITFAAAQLPLGVLLDRYGPRKIEAGLLLLAALGATVFALGSSTQYLIIGRGLIGFGVSACLMAAFKAFTQWFEAKQLPLINGIIMASGGMGALAATTPVQAALKITDWRGVFLILAVFTLFSSLTIYFVVPDAPEQARQEKFSVQFRGIKKVYTNSFFWRIAPLAILSQGSFISIQSLWSGPWLRDIGGLSRDQSADVLLLIAGAMMAGFLGMGLLAERLARLGISPVKVSGTGMLLFIITQAVIVATPELPWVTTTWVLFGFFGTAGIIQYASLSQHFPRELAGRVNTAINLLVFVSAFVLQWAIGAIINHWPQSSLDKYTQEGYQAAFGLLLLMQVAAYVWFLVPRPGSR